MNFDNVFDKREKKINDYDDNILSIELIINDLIEWKDTDYFKLLDEKKNWINHLFDGLKKRNCN